MGRVYAISINWSSRRGGDKGEAVYGIIERECRWMVIDECRSVGKGMKRRRRSE